MEQHGKHRHFVRGRFAFFVVLLVISFVSSATAQGDARFFPETGHYIRSTFRSFWEANGGLFVFGYPITEEYQSPTTGNLEQYFERSRFEMKILNGQPYVELGKLGLETTSGRVFPKAQPIQNTAQKRYIPQSQYIIQYGFKQIWETYGADRIFGLPISNELEEMLPDGKKRVVQYFERARFEYWPEQAPGQRVVISTLGRLVVPSSLTTPINQPVAAPTTQAAVPTQPTSTQPQEPTVPQDVQSTVTPKSGIPGTEFQFKAQGFEPNEAVSIWLTSPGTKTATSLDEVQANDSGEVGEKVKKIRTGHLTEMGVWTVTAQGKKSSKQAFGYFLLGSTAQPTQAQPAQPGSQGAGQPVSGIPSPVLECVNNAPSPVQGVAQAWMEKGTVAASEKETNRVCTRLILNGQIITGAEARGIVRFDDEPLWIGPEKTREQDGVASIKFKVDKKEAGKTVMVDTEILYGGQSYLAQASFTLQ